MNITFKKDRVELIGNQWDIIRNEVLVDIEKIIARIEEEFDSTDKTYLLTTINFNSQNASVTEVDEITKTMIINLPAYDMGNDNNSIYQRKLNLSHELIHTITPCGDPDKTTFLDEGLAVVFSEKYTGCGSGPAGNYYVAKNLVLSLLNIDNQIIRKLRKKHPDKKISDYTIQDIIGEIPPCNLNLVKNLAKLFYKT